MDDLRLAYKIASGHVLMKLLGSLNLMTMDQLGRGLAQAMDSSGISKVVLDLAGLDFIDSNGIGALVAASKTATNRGGYVRLLNMRPRLQEALHITHLDSLFPAYTTLDEATSP
jgi:anti-sigma B factor antagonist